jgi:predicted ArsR family transcriptional regulator
MTRLEALANPVRLRMVRRLETGPPASLSELAAAADVHPNTARPHVTALESAGVVERRPPEGGRRGRPRVDYQLADGWSPVTANFRGLAELLAAALLRAGAGPDQVRSAGLEWGRYLQGRPGGHDVDEDLRLALEQIGFRAKVCKSKLMLDACPCPLVLPDRPELVCELAASVADGVLAGSASDLRVEDRHHDPDARRCSIALEGVRRPGKARTRKRLRSPNVDA